jgi:hypothetical protein
MNAKNRLALYRKRAAEAKNPHFANWRVCRYGTMRGYRKTEAQFTHSDGLIYADSFEVIGQKMADSHEIIRLRHTGYYADLLQYGVIRGAVVLLKTSKGAFYIPATYCTEWDGVTLYMKNAEVVEKGLSEDCHEGAKVRMAYIADSIAEREAERARDDDEKYRAEEKVQELREEIVQTRATVRELITEIKSHGAFTPAICATLRKTVREELERVRNLRAGVEELTNRPWMIHEWRG